MRKQLYVYYTINDIEFVKVFHERVLVQKGHVEIKHSNYDGKSSYFVNIPNSEPWLTLIDRDSAKDEKDTIKDRASISIRSLSKFRMSQKE